MSGDFVGRADEVAAVGALVEATRRERRVGALLLLGDPGIGKSRLLDEAARRLGRAPVLRFSGYEPESSVPLAAASPMLRRLAASGEDRTFHGLLDPDAEVGGLDAIRVFESVHRQLARERSSILIVDDLQWVDPVSIALCHFLIRANAGSGRGFALVVASRPSPVLDRFGASLATVLGAGAPLETVRLAPLSRDDGVRLVASRSGGIDRTTAISLWERAGGSPFWLDLLSTAPRTEHDVHDAVETRMRGLGTDANVLLGTLAILGRPVDSIELEGVLDWAPGRGASASIELVAGGLAIDDGGTVRLAHDLIRAVVVQHLTSTTIRQLEDRIATALERYAGADVAALLAALEHRVAAGSFDSGLALRILQAPQRRLIGSEGVHRIAELARDVTDPGARVDVDEATAMLAVELGDEDLAFDRWSSVASATADRERAGRAELGAAFAAYDLGRAAEARRGLDRSRARIGGAPDAAIAADALEGRILLWLERRIPEGRAVAMRAVERGRREVAAATDADASPGRAADPVRVAYVDALAAAWEAAIQAEDVDAIVGLAEESLEASREMGLRSVLAAREMVGMALEYAAPQLQAADAYRGVWDDASRAVLPTEAVDAGFRLASILFDALHLDEAARVALEAERLAARAGDHGRVRDRSRLVKYQLAMARSDWRAGVTAILAAAEDEPDPHYRFVHHQLAATWLARIGADADEAVRNAETGRALVAAAGCPGCGRDMEIAAAEVFARCGRPRDAAAAIETWDAADRRTYLEAEWLRRRAGVLLAASEGAGPTETRVALATLRDEADALDLGLHALWTELDLARGLAQADREASAASFRRAAERAEAAGAETLRRVADHGLRELGERTWRRGASQGTAGGLGALSEREREVAALVAGGATNPEIASRLFLSRKTVEHHVSNALAKLGLRSRAELAALVGRTGPAPGEQDGAPPP